MKLLGGILMKNIGLVKTLDHLGRIVIPIELRKSLFINTNDRLEILIEDENIILKKYSASRSCFITGEKLNSNVEYAPGLVLSEKGAETLLKELKKREIRY